MENAISLKKFIEAGNAFPLSKEYDFKFNAINPKDNTLWCVYSIDGDTAKCYTRNAWGGIPESTFSLSEINIYNIDKV